MTNAGQGASVSRFPPGRVDQARKGAAGARTEWIAQPGCPNGLGTVPAHRPSPGISSMSSGWTWTPGVPPDAQERKPRTRTS